MTDYKEEQENELEALESIYPDELTIIALKPFTCFTISLAGEYKDYDAEETCSCVLQFTYKEKYPDEIPDMEVQYAENLDDLQQQLLLDLMKEQAEETIGMAMVFTVVAAVQDHLHSLMEQVYRDKKEAIERKVQEEEEKERKRFEGTCVNVDTFLAWKAKFDAEMAELKRQRGQADLTSNKLSGLELFMQNEALDDSDVQFLEEDGAVAVDESLFDDLDDLEIDDDDES